MIERHGERGRERERERVREERDIERERDGEREMERERERDLKRERVNQALKEKPFNFLTMQPTFKIQHTRNLWYNSRVL